MSLKISTSVLAAGFVIASLAVSVGPSVAADQTAASHRVRTAHHRYPGRTRRASMAMLLGMAEGHTGLALDQATPLTTTHG
jgi:hypothetical protein